MQATTRALTTALLICGIGAAAGAIKIASGQPASAQSEASAGKRVFKTANCVGCHKWHGGGGGGYGGAALSLRATQLTRDQIIETVTCGRPGTGMPYFKRNVYETKECYGLNKQDLGDNMPPGPPTFLRPNEIAAVADYVMADVKGKGEPTYAQCVDFFGQSSRVCNVYKEGGHGEPGEGKAEPSKQGG
ncbi:MAG: c-type cytochrome [Acetobacteraceae bacterium]|nr:c-type cytochrome [Acetobacteraceae bacterium]